MDHDVQAFRRRRLADLLLLPEFSGRKAELGRALGYESGAYIRQLLEGERPISEKTVDLIETIKGKKYAGWFTPRTASQDEAQLLAAFRALAGDAVATARALAYVEGLAASAADSLGGARTPSASQSPMPKQAA